jgi:hypothetical protein
MTMHHNNGAKSVPQSRRSWGSYKLPIEARATLAIVLIERGWSLKAAAAALCVNQTYLRLARRLDAGDRWRLARGELKLAGVHRDYYQRLEQSKPAKHFSNGGAAILSDSVIENLVREVGVDRIWRAVDRLTQPEQSRIAAE